MKLLDQIEILKTICKAKNQWGIMVHFPESEWYKNDLTVKKFYIHLKKAAPWFDIHNDIHAQAFIDEFAIILCKSEKECDTIFESTIGDDGPIYGLNKYNGPVRVTCVTCNNKGQPQRENT
jgi:hypothetical protein